ncbi:hypothetical protein AQJ23_00785 [Streptomyces antibioticus]|nr:hypothetical protein AQJ23_00785 [Streptomyces antibioticus]
MGGIGAGLVRCVRTWNEWLIVWGYDVDAGPPNLTEEYALSVVRKLIGNRIRYGTRTRWASGWASRDRSPTWA